MALYTYLSLAAALSYTITCGLLVRQFVTDRPLNRQLFFIAGFLSLLFHGASCLYAIQQAEGYLFNLLNALSLSFFLSSLFLYALTLKEPLENLGMIMFPMATLAVIATVILDPPENSKIIHSPSILIHILLALSSNAMITLASLQSGMLAIGHYQLKRKSAMGFFQKFPPLDTMEHILFQLIWAGVIFLSLGIATGFLFYENLFLQHLSHKTFFTLCAWGIFVILLIGRHIFGWRGLQAVRWTNWGFLILLLGFVGSGIVLEFILKKT